MFVTREKADVAMPHLAFQYSLAITKSISLALERVYAATYFKLATMLHTEPHCRHK